jgi:hypothetical protein
MSGGATRAALNIVGGAALAAGPADKTRLDIAME